VLLVRSTWLRPPIGCYDPSRTDADTLACPSQNKRLPGPSSFASHSLDRCDGISDPDDDADAGPGTWYDDAVLTSPSLDALIAAADARYTRCGAAGHRQAISLWEERHGGKTIPLQKHARS